MWITYIILCALMVLQPRLNAFMSPLQAYSCLLKNVMETTTLICNLTLSNPSKPTIPNASGRRIDTCKPLMMKPEKKNMRPRGRVMKAKPAIAPLLSSLHFSWCKNLHKKLRKPQILTISATHTDKQTNKQTQFLGVTSTQIFLQTST